MTASINAAAWHAGFIAGLNEEDAACPDDLDTESWKQGYADGRAKPKLTCRACGSAFGAPDAVSLCTACLEQEVGTLHLLRKKGSVSPAQRRVMHLLAHSMMCTSEK